MDAVFLLALPLWLINLFLAALVFSRQPRSLPNQTFAFFVLTVLAWSFTVQYLYVSGATASIWWKRLPFVAASLIGSSFVVFCEVFPDLKNLCRNRGSKLFLGVGALMAGLSLTPLVVHNANITDAGAIRPRYGPLYPLFALFMVAAFGYGIGRLSGKWWAARGRRRLQMQYLWLGLCWAIGGGTITNLLIPALTGDSRLGPYGPYFSLVLIGLTAHAIIRHRLMDMRVIIRQSVTYGVAAGAAVGILWGLFIIMDRGFGVRLQPSSPFLPLLIGVAGAVVFHPVRSLIQHVLDRYCYRQEYDYRQAIRRISQVLAGLLRIDPLCECLTSFILNTLKVEEVAVYLCHEPSFIELRSSRHAGNGEQGQPGTLTVLSPRLMTLLARARQPILQDELALWVEVSDQAPLHEEFILLGSKVLIPLSGQADIAGIIAVGEKRSGDPFFSQDLEFLATIGHQAEAALRRAQLHEQVTWMKEYNESILRHMESGLVVVGHDSVITVVNDAAARMLEVHPTTVVGQPLDRLIACGVGLPLLDTLLQKTAYTNHEATLVTTSGRDLPVVLSTSILHGEDDQLSGAILAFNDLSQIKILEEEKRRIERLASIGAFMSGIAHEIKNPLVAIKTLAELLPEQYDDEEFRDTFTKVTLNEVNRIDALVRRLRSLSSGSAVPLHPLNILTPLEETLSLVSGELTRRSLTLVREYPASVPPVLGDHDQLKQVFVNLCLNSVEAMDKGGTLRVTVAGQGKQAGQPDELVVQLCDTGPGIPAEHLSTIFDPFFTLKEQGTGLGLAICRGIIDYHRGSITAANGSEGLGAVFTVKLPVAQGVEGYESTVVGYQQA
jgi:nitrogen-specific signal transduction histidine kinase